MPRKKSQVSSNALVLPAFRLTWGFREREPGTFLDRFTDVLRDGEQNLHRLFARGWSGVKRR